METFRRMLLTCIKYKPLNVECRRPTTMKKNDQNDKEETTANHLDQCVPENMQCDRWTYNREEEWTRIEACKKLYNKPHQARAMRAFQASCLQGSDHHKQNSIIEVQLTAATYLELRIERMPATLQEMRARTRQRYQKSMQHTCTAVPGCSIIYSCHLQSEWWEWWEKASNNRPFSSCPRSWRRPCNETWVRTWGSIS